MIFLKCLNAHENIIHNTKNITRITIYANLET